MSIYESLYTAFRLKAEATKHVVASGFSRKAAAAAAMF